MKINACLIIIILLFTTFHQASAQEASGNSNTVLLTAILKLEHNLNNVNDKIKLYENSIVRCNNTITTSTSIINSARESGNKEAEKVANDALQKSIDNKKKNIDLLNSARLQKKKYETNLSKLKEEIQSESKNKKQNSAVLIKYSGDISITKSNGNKFKLDEESFPLLEPGDEITTSENSKVELQFLEGRGEMVLGEKSSLKLNENDSTVVLDFKTGKVQLNVSSVEEFSKYLEEQKEFSLNKEIEKYFDRIRAKWQKKFEVRRGSGTGGLRGTEFITNAYDKATEFIVIEGCVELRSDIGQKTILINAGQKGVIDNEGKLSEPQDIDLTTLENWWADEE